MESGGILNCVAMTIDDPLKLTGWGTGGLVCRKLRSDWTLIAVMFTVFSRDSPELIQTIVSISSVGGNMGNTSFYGSVV